MLDFVCHESGMQQADFIPRNKSEEMRAKAWKQLQQGKLGRYTILSTLGLERHTIADTDAPEIVHPV